MERGRLGGHCGGIGNAGNLGFASPALRQAAGNAITQGIGVATGIQDKFSWAGVAAASVGAAAFRFASTRLPGAATATADASFANRIGASTASLLADAATRSLIEGTNFGDNILAALPNVIGQTSAEKRGCAHRCARQRRRARAPLNARCGG